MEILATLHRLDVRLFMVLFQLTNRHLVRQIARALSRSADGYLCALIPALLWLTGSGDPVMLLQLLLWGLCAERCLYWLLKNGLRRRRPQEYMPDFRSIIVAADRFSFPSGHTSVAFLLATSLTVVHQELAMAIYLWACGVALSRIVLGVHYPGDTVAGAFMGSMVALVVAGHLGMPA